jgi:hypothetical protein
MKTPGRYTPASNTTPVSNPDGTTVHKQFRLLGLVGQDTKHVAHASIASVELAHCMLHD